MVVLAAEFSAREVEAGGSVEGHHQLHREFKDSHMRPCPWKNKEPTPDGLWRLLEQMHTHTRQIRGGGAG